MRWLSAGESHGPAMGLLLEGLPAGLPVNAGRLDSELARRQAGYGRGGRMAIERDRVEVLAGLRHGLTLGSPLLLIVRNLDHANWAEAMQPLAPVPHPGAEVRVPRPGHADLAGALKYGHHDLRNVLERASARETVNRVLAGAVAMQLLEALGVQVGSFVTALGGVEADPEMRPGLDTPAHVLAERADLSPVRCLDARATALMVAAIDAAQAAGDTLGGKVELRATGVPVGLGSHVHWDRRLDGRLGAALLSLPAVKGVELGDAFSQAMDPGSRSQDAIRPSASGGLERTSNRQGGLEGGMTNGETLWLRLAMKPLSTLRQPLPSVQLDDLSPHSAHRERSDVCALPALAVTAEHALAWELAQALLEVFGADSWAETQRRFAEGPARWSAILGPGAT